MGGAVTGDAGMFAYALGIRDKAGRTGVSRRLEEGIMFCFQKVKKVVFLPELIVNSNGRREEALKTFQD